MMDTSAYLAIHEKDDDSTFCERAIADNRLPVFVTSFVVTETHRRFLFDHGQAAAFSFLHAIYGGTPAATIERPTEEDERDALAILQRHQGLAMTFCDAVTIAVMKRKGIFKAFTHDRRHFVAVGVVVMPPFY